MSKTENIEKKYDTLDLSVGQVSVTVFSECIFLGKETVKETAVGDFFIFFIFFYKNVS